MHISTTVVRLVLLSVLLSGAKSLMYNSYLVTQHLLRFSTRQSKYIMLPADAEACRKVSMLKCCHLLHYESFGKQARENLKQLWREYRAQPWKYPQPSLPINRLVEAEVPVTVQAIDIYADYNKPVIMIHFFCVDTRPQHTLNYYKEQRISRQFAVSCLPNEFTRRIQVRSQFLDPSLAVEFGVSNYRALDMRCEDTADLDSAQLAELARMYQPAQQSLSVGKEAQLIRPYEHDCLEFHSADVRTDTIAVAYTVPTQDLRDQTEAQHVNPVYGLATPGHDQSSDSVNEEPVYAEMLSLAVHRSHEEPVSYFRQETNTQLIQENINSIMRGAGLNIDSDRLIACVLAGASPLDLFTQVIPESNF